MTVAKGAGEALGAEVSSALFDRVRTCDNHCEFCFIYQLPKGMRQEPVPEGRRLPAVLSLRELHHPDPLHRARSRAGARRGPVAVVRLHPQHRPRRCGPGCCATPGGPPACAGCGRCSTAGIEVHGQVVVCPGVNDGDALETTLAGVLDEYPELATVACVPLGVSDYTTEAAMRAHTSAEAEAVIETVEQWQELAVGALGRRLVYAADEYYLIAGRPFPESRALRRLPPARERDRDGPGLRRRLRRRRRGRLRGAARVLRLGRRRAGRRATGPRGPTPAPDRRPPDGRRDAGGGDHGRVRGHGARAAPGRPRRRRAWCDDAGGPVAARAQRLLRGEHRRHRPSHRRRRGPGPGAGSRRATAICYPTSVCPRDGSSTG